MLKYFIIYIIIFVIFFFLIKKIEKDVPFFKRLMVSFFWVPCFFIALFDFIKLILSNIFVKEDEEEDNNNNDYDDFAGEDEKDDLDIYK